ncbi:NHLP leader peptide family natural product precursor [Nostoc sp. KVJ3]|uniref:NHLP leader peptide family RiPP precursor n=1 Tax=Nostoc sp. KVJ3 TaxID=457945 RepID=UPI002237E76E|nr:NHLP leader peptide family RiPP precursor [Nostoc sp. KVJ3]MCW5315516.1 NHLP leader peptide family natural product precursor [Nostoc sp. KVJ3]
MSEQEQAQTRQDIEARIIAKAWKDEAYKQELLNNPKAAIEREFGVEFPADVNVQVLEENSTSLHFVLPMSPVAIAQELSEEQLEAIAGGAGALSKLTKWVANNQSKLVGTPLGALSVSASYYGVTK